MRQVRAESVRVEWPPALLELSRRLDAAGLRSCWQGEALLDRLRPRAGGARAGVVEAPSIGAVNGAANAGETPCLLVEAAGAELARALPDAVVTAEELGRLSVPSAVGPIDLLPTGSSTLEEGLLGFGLGPLAIGASAPGEDEDEGDGEHGGGAAWLDPAGQREALAAGRLETTHEDGGVFDAAPRRYWIAARLIAERALEPSDALVATGRDRLPELVDRLPIGPPARRELARILATADPAPALAFLRETGVLGAVVPGTQVGHAERLARLPALPALRWAAFLRGAATASAMVRLRVPHDLARRVERIQGAHPIERHTATSRDTALRRLDARLSAAEIDALFAWRRLELRESLDRPAADATAATLDALEARLASLREHKQRVGRVRTLALDGRAVMTLLDAGPGPHVGRALAHLARHVEAHPEDDTAEALTRVLRGWADAHLGQGGAPPAAGARDAPEADAARPDGG